MDESRTATPTTARAGKAEREAKVAGLRNFTTPSLDDVERRRWQLWGLTCFVLVGVAGALVLLSLYPGDLPAQLDQYVNFRIIRIAMIGVVVAFCGYAFEKEVHLRRLSRILIDERVLTAAFSNRLKEFSKLTDVGKAINSVLELDDVLGLILDSCLDLLEVDEGSIMLLSEDGTTLRAVTFRGDPVVAGATQSVGVGVAGWVAANRESLLVTGKADPRFFPDAVAKDRPVASAICVPLLSRDTLYGVLNVNDLDGSRAFSEYELRAISLFAEHAAIAIANASLYRTAQDRVAHLTELDELKREFVTLVSHELRTPLTSILGSASTLERAENRLDPEDRKELFQVIKRQGDHLFRLVEDILLTSRIESGMQIVASQLCDIAALAREAAAAFRARPGGDRVTVTGVSELTVVADPAAAHRVFQNLLENAWKYAPDSAVTIDIKATQSDAEISVTDEGPGVDPQHLTRIFDRFHQVEAITNRRAPGVGLGLYIVRHLVEAQGGTIRCESEPGRGARFVFTLPRAMSGHGEEHVERGLGTGGP